MSFWLNILSYMLIYALLCFMLGMGFLNGTILICFVREKESYIVYYATFRGIKNTTME